ncbi:MAG: primosomal protein N' [Bacillota bacterium]
MDNRAYAAVLVDISAKSLEREFHYAVPAGFEAKINIGSRVLVPFGGRKVSGYVTGFGPPPGDLLAEKGVKEVLGLLDEGPVFTPAQMDLARWMAEYYLCSPVAALNAVIWPRIQGTEVKKIRGLYVNDSAEVVPPFKGITNKRKSVLETAGDNPGMSRKDLARAAGVSVGIVDKLVSGGFLCYGETEIRRDPYPDEEHSPDNNVINLNLEQAAALDQIIKAVDRDQREVFLLHGVTSSGKTEVYLRSIAHTLWRGRQAVVMVPEISLTPQMVSVFKRRFGDRVAVLHSRLSAGERYDEWRRIEIGEAPVVLGARSAAFAPLDKLGLIILDEEHEHSYKQEETPRYHARDIALKLAGRFEAVAVLGSATPAVESYFRAQPGGPYSLLSLTKRVEMRPLPEVTVIDMREELKAGNSGLFSRCLVDAVRERLERREQIILFINRRGYSTFVVCRDCGLVMKCPHCDISLTYHAGRHLKCHYCNHSSTAPGYCPDCGSQYIGYFGTGTQKVEEEVEKLFPGARTIRMDSDTTSRKGSHGRILGVFRDGGADILIGTQMVAKGLDLPAVTLVGVISADVTLYMPDFRAAERTFQLVAQVAGRAGRGDLGGEVLVQTYSPDNYSIIYASRHDYNNFYLHEMNLRKIMQYPPYTRLGRILVSGEDEEAVKRMSEKLAVIASEIAIEAGGIEIMGPAAAPLSRIKDRYRFHLIIKSKSGKKLRALLKNITDRVEFKNKGNLSLMVDIDPLNLM